MPGALFAISCYSESSGEDPRTFKWRWIWPGVTQGATGELSRVRDLMTASAMSVVLSARALCESGRGENGHIWQRGPEP